MGGGEVVLDGDGERGKVLVADDLAELASAWSIPSAIQCRHMSPFCQRLTLRLVARQMPTIDSIGLVLESVRQSCS